MSGTSSSVNTPGALLLIGAGAATFFCPFVTAGSPVHGKTDWSPADLLIARADLWVPAPPPLHVHEILYGIALVYLLMILSMFVLALPSPQTPLRVITVIGSALSMGMMRYAEQSFGWLLYGKRTHSLIYSGDHSFSAMFGWQGLRLDAAFGVFIFVMPLLFLAAGRRPRSQ